MRTLRSLVGDIGIRLGLVAGLVAGALMVSSCGVTEPDDTSWQDVSKFSWPANTSTRMTYEVKQLNFGKLQSVNTQDVSTVADSGRTFNGRQLYMINDESLTLPLRIRYTATRDSLVTFNAPFGGNVPLVGPLDKGHTWISGYDNSGTTPTWKATIIEKLAVLQLDWKQYKNVIGVKYEMIGPKGDPQVCYRYYAEGIGPIKTVQNTYQGSSPVETADPTWTEQRILTETSATQN